MGVTGLHFDFQLGHPPIPPTGFCRNKHRHCTAQEDIPVVDGCVINLRARWSQLHAAPWFYSYMQWLGSIDKGHQLVREQEPWCGQKIQLSWYFMEN